MLVRLFRSNQPGVLVLLLVLVPVLFLQHLHPMPVATNEMPLYRYLGGLYHIPWLHGALVICIIVFLAAQLTALMNSAELVEQRNHLPALLFPVLLATLAAPGSLGPALLGMPFVLWALRRSWSINNRDPALSALFDAGLLLGFAAQLYVPYAFVVVVVWASVAVVRPFQWREYLVPLLGILLVSYLGWAVMHLLGAPASYPLRTIAHKIPFVDRTSGLYRAMLLFVLMAFAVVSLVQFARQYGRGVVREQNLRSSFMAFSATLAVVIVLVSLLNGWYPPVLLAVPLAVLFPFALLGTRRQGLAEVAGMVLLALALWKQYG